MNGCQWNVESLVPVKQCRVPQHLQDASEQCLGTAPSWTARTCGESWIQPRPSCKPTSLPLTPHPASARPAASSRTSHTPVTPSFPLSQQASDTEVWKSKILEHTSTFKGSFFLAVIRQMNHPTNNEWAILSFYRPHQRPLDYLYLDFTGLYVALNITHFITYRYTVDGSIVIMYNLSADLLACNNKAFHRTSTYNKLN